MANQTVMLESAVTPEESDALFAHMQELVDALPAMEKKGRALARARAAEEVEKNRRYHEGLVKECGRIQEEFEAHVKAHEAARAAGDATSEESERYAVLNFGNQKAFREGAVASALRALNHALEQGGFATAEEARAALLDKDALAALVADVEAFQKDYAETLAACQALLDEEDAEGVE